MKVEVGDQFTCAVCHEVFTNTRPDSIDLAEYAENFPIEYAMEMEVDDLCEDCYGEFMSWWETQIPRE